LMISKNDIRAAVGLAFLLIVQIQAARISFAEELPPSLYSEMEWRMIGPFRAGKVNGVAGVPGNPAIYFMGADGGGVWKTADGGVTWKPIFDGGFAASIGAVVVAPSNPNILYVGTGVNTIYGDVSYGNGVYQSTDGGETWARGLGGFKTHRAHPGGSSKPRHCAGGGDRRRLRAE